MKSNNKKFNITVDGQGAFLAPGLGWILPAYGKTSKEVRKALKEKKNMTVAVTGIGLENGQNVYYGEPAPENVKPNLKDLAAFWAEVPADAARTYLASDLRKRNDAVLLRNTEGHLFFFKLDPKEVQNAPKTLLGLLQDYAAPEENEVRKYLATNLRHLDKEITKVGNLPALVNNAEETFVLIRRPGGELKLVQFEPDKGCRLTRTGETVGDILANARYGATWADLSREARCVALTSAPAPSCTSPMIERALADGIITYGINATGDISGYSWAPEALPQVLRCYTNSSLRQLLKELAAANEAAATRLDQRYELLSRVKQSYIPARFNCIAENEIEAPAGLAFPRSLAYMAQSPMGVRFLVVKDKDEWTDEELASFSNKQFRLLVNRSRLINGGYKKEAGSEAAEAETA